MTTQTTEVEPPIRVDVVAMTAGAVLFGLGLYRPEVRAVRKATNAGTPAAEHALTP